MVGVDAVVEVEGGDGDSLVRRDPAEVLDIDGPGTAVRGLGAVLVGRSGLHWGLEIHLVRGGVIAERPVAAFREAFVQERALRRDVLAEFADRADPFVPVDEGLEGVHVRSCIEVHRRVVRVHHVLGIEQRIDGLVRFLDPIERLHRVEEGRLVHDLVLDEQGDAESRVSFRRIGDIRGVRRHYDPCAVIDGTDGGGQLADVFLCGVLAGRADFAVIEQRVLPDHPAVRIGLAQVDREEGVRGLRGGGPRGGVAGKARGQDDQRTGNGLPRIGLEHVDGDRTDRLRLDHLAVVFEDVRCDRRIEPTRAEVDEAVMVRFGLSLQFRDLRLVVGIVRRCCRQRGGRQCKKQREKEKCGQGAVDPSDGSCGRA